MADRKHHIASNGRVGSSRRQFMRSGLAVTGVCTLPTLAVAQQEDDESDDDTGTQIQPSRQTPFRNGRTNLKLR